MLDLLLALSLGLVEDNPPILRISEIDGSKQPQSLRSDHPIVDYWSTLGIKVDHPALESAIRSKHSTPQTDDLAAKLSTLTQAIDIGTHALKEHQRDVLAYIQDASNSDKKLQADAISHLENGKRKLSRACADILKVAVAYPAFRERMNKALDSEAYQSREKQYPVILQTAASQVDILRVELKEALAAEGTFVQLGVWILNEREPRPLHVPGFDAYPEDRSVEHGRFYLPLGEMASQGAALNQFVKDTNDKGGFKGLLKTSGQEFVKGMEQQVKTWLEPLRTELESDAENLLAEVDPLVKSIKIKVISLDATLKDLKKRYGALDSTSLLFQVASIKADVEGLLDQVVNLEADVKALLGKVPSLQAEAQGKLKNLLQKIQDLPDMGKFTAAVKSNLPNWLQGLADQSEAARKLGEFGSEVKRLNLEDLPEESKVRLSGPRSPGDQVEVRCRIGWKDGETKELYNQVLDIYKVQWHVDWVPGAVAAHPLSQTAFTGSVQAAPSYNILFRAGSRTSRAYNEWWNLGVGINLAALDFNQDGTPELGVGLVLSGLKDYFQLGVGYNTNLSKWYTFFGIRLPLPSVTGN